MNKMMHGRHTNVIEIIHPLNLLTSSCVFEGRARREWVTESSKFWQSLPYNTRFPKNFYSPITLKQQT